MPQIFVRHKEMTEGGHFLSAAYQEDLWDRQTVALVFSDIASFDPIAYQNAGLNSEAQVFERVRGYFIQGCIVAASFRDIRPDSMLVGRIFPNNFNQHQINHVGGHHYKEITLETAGIVLVVSHPALLSQPRGGAICQWHQLPADYLEAALNGMPLPRDVHSLSESQLEILCYEFMRRELGLASILLPIGRTLPDIDVLGLGEAGNLVAAQVTFSSNPAEITYKANRLMTFGLHDPAAQLHFFGPADRADDAREVNYHAIEHVFARMLECDDFQPWFNRTLG